MEKHILTMVDRWLKILICVGLMSSQVMSTPNPNSNNVSITVLESAVAKGAGLYFLYLFMELIILPILFYH